MLTEREQDRIRALNRKNRYGITLAEVKLLFERHQAARKRGDSHEMEKIEYRLTDINFHYECGLLSSGQYDKITEVIKNW
ncbi:MAG: hypothetical protein IJE22_03170 [Oscillibacter sp.]|nr:hypothetical protein [Oscillibacter sp.]